MKKQYFADKRDYLKYSILRHLHAQGISITVCWMLTPDDHTGQGAHKGYLKAPKRWRSCDAGVFDFLKAQVDGGFADIHSVEREGPISSCRFYWERFQPDPVNRKRYLDGCLDMASGTDLIFFDPDTGPEPEKPKANDMDKYVLGMKSSGHTNRVTLSWYSTSCGAESLTKTILLAREGSCSSADCLRRK